MTDESRHLYKKKFREGRGEPQNPSVNDLDERI